MKKVLFILIGVIIISSLLFSGCAKTSTTTPAPQKTSAAPPATTAVAPPKTSVTPPTTTAAPLTTTQPAAGAPQYGGTMRVINGFGIATNLGDPRKPGTFPTWNDWREGLAQWSNDGKGNYIPWLLESWDMDASAKTMTFHIRKNVKFHDGSTLTAQDVKWNLQQQSGNLPDIQDVTSMDVLDDYTLRLNFSKFSALNLITITFAVPMFSQKAIEGAATDYYLTHEAATGAFKVVDYKASSYVKLAKFDDYWGTKPYLDGIQINAVSDPTVASLTMIKGDADVWCWTPLKEAMDLKAKGFNIQGYLGGISWLAMDSANPSSEYANQKVREAVELAIDRPAIAKTVGLGQWLPLTQWAAPQDTVYIPGLDPRPYNPAKAKQLLSDAGYPNGFQTTLTTLNDSESIMQGSLMQSYLGAVGIKVNIDQTDRARYNSITMPGGTGWKNGMVLMTAGHNPGVGYVRLDLGNYFSTRPNTWQTSVAKGAAWGPLYDQVATCPSFDAAAAIGKKMVQEIADEAMVVPLWDTAALAVFPSYVHTSMYQAQAPSWLPELDWMEKH